MFNVTIHVETDQLDVMRYMADGVPDGTTCDILTSDLEAGNFEVVHLELPSGIIKEIKYSGPVAEGYVSPFETQPVEVDL